MYLTIDSLIYTNNILTGSNNISLRNVHIKANGYDKMYMDNDFIEDKLYQVIELNWSKLHKLYQLIQWKRN